MNHPDPSHDPAQLVDEYFLRDLSEQEIDAREGRHPPVLHLTIVE